MVYIPDSGPDVAGTARTFRDRLSAISGHFPTDSRCVVDLGAYNGRFCVELAESHGVNGIAIEADHTVESLDHPLVAWHPHEMDARGLGKIIRDQRETYGPVTVLLLSVLHHLPEWRKFVDVVERNADYAFIETANPDEILPTAKSHDQSAAVLRWVEKRGDVIHESPGWDSSHVRKLWRLDFGL